MKEEFQRKILDYLLKNEIKNILDPIMIIIKIKKSDYVSERMDNKSRQINSRFQKALLSLK